MYRKKFFAVKEFLVEIEGLVKRGKSINEVEEGSRSISIKIAVHL